MFWYNLKLAVRYLLTNKKISSINIIGFAFAISICLAISLYLINEYSYDRYHKYSKQIVRLIDTKDNSSLIDYRIKDILQKNFPEIENGCLLQRRERPVEVRNGEKGFYLDDIMSVDNNFFEVFSVPFIRGNSNSPFVNINSAVITENTAKFLFGSDDPMGKELIIMGTVPVTITGIIQNFPDNSSIFASILVNAENDNFKFSKRMGDSSDTTTFRWPFQIYFKLNSNVYPNQLIIKVNKEADLLKPYSEQIGFMKLKDIYLHDPTTGSVTRQGNANLLKLLTIIALIILILAVINYVNLNVSQQIQRNRDTSVKKAFGANRKNIFFQFLSESVIVISVAFFSGLFLLWMLVKFYQAVFNTTADLNLLFRFPYYLVLIGTILIIGLISGIGPALVFSGFNPVFMLRGVTVLKIKRNYLRNFMTIFQFLISIILILCVLIVQKQIRYVKHKNPGFNEEQLLRLDVPNISNADNKNSLSLLEDLRRSPYIKNLSVTTGVPGNIRMNGLSHVVNSDKNTNIWVMLADTSFIETFGLKIIKGRNLESGEFNKVCMINETAYKQFEFENLENKRLDDLGGFDIIAVVNDFQFTSLHSKIEPLCIMFSSVRKPSAINIRFAKNSVEDGMEFVVNDWQKILPGYPIKYQFYDEWFNSVYKSDDYFAKIINLFAILAIVISCIGIFGLSIFSSERRTKEIGIRKINGARISEILLMLNKEFILLVMIAYLIAIPIAWYAMHKWLESFAYKTELSWWIFGLTGIFALIIALLTVSWQSWKAATSNPVDSLKYE